MAESTNFNVNMPYVATINADGTLTIETIKHQSYQLTAADLEFNAYLLNGVFKSFMVSDEVSGATALLNVDLNADLSGEWIAEFVRNLQYAPSAPSDLSGAKEAPAPNAVFLQAWLEGIARSSLADELISNGVAAALEASDLSPLEITNFAEDASAGAANMWNGINDLTPQMRSLIATQIRNASYMDISHNAEYMQGLLPVRANDTITFQFIVNQQYTVTEVGGIPGGVNVGPPAGGAVGVGESPYNYDTRPLGTYGVGSKRINVIMKRLDGADYRDLCGAADSFYNTDVSDNERDYNDASGAYYTAVAAKAVADASMNTFYAEWQVVDASYNMAVALDATATAAEAKYQELSGALIVATANAAAAIGTPQYAELVHIKEKLEQDVSSAKLAYQTADASANSLAIAAGVNDASALLTSRDAAKTTYTNQVTAVTAATNLVRLRAGQMQAAKEALSAVNRRYEGLKLKRDAAKATAEFNRDNAQIIYDDASGAYHTADAQRLADISDAGVATGSKWALFVDASQNYYDASANLAANPGDAALAATYQEKLELANAALEAYTAARALAVASRAAADSALTAAKAAETDRNYWRYHHQEAGATSAVVATVFPASVAAITLPAAPAAMAL